MQTFPAFLLLLYVLISLAVIAATIGQFRRGENNRLTLILLGLCAPQIVLSETAFLLLLLDVDLLAVSLPSILTTAHLATPILWGMALFAKPKQERTTT